MPWLSRVRWVQSGHAPVNRIVHIPVQPLTSASLKKCILIVLHVLAIVVLVAALLKPNEALLFLMQWLGLSVEPGELSKLVLVILLPVTTCLELFFLFGIATGSISISVFFAILAATSTLCLSIAAFYHKPLCIAATLSAIVFIFATLYVLELGQKRTARHCTNRRRPTLGAIEMEP